MPICDHCSRVRDDDVIPAEIYWCKRCVMEDYSLLQNSGAENLPSKPYSEYWWSKPYNVKRVASLPRRDTSSKEIEELSQVDVIPDNEIQQEVKQEFCKRTYYGIDCSCANCGRSNVRRF